MYQRTQMIDNAIEKMRTSAEAIDSPIIKMLSQQIIDNIKTDHVAEKILEKDKTLAGCKKTFDEYASKNKSGRESVIDPVTAEKLIFDYFDINDADLNIKASGIINILDYVK